MFMFSCVVYSHLFVAQTALNNPMISFFFVKNNINHVIYFKLSSWFAHFTTKSFATRFTSNDWKSFNTVICNRLYNSFLFSFSCLVCACHSSYSLLLFLPIRDIVVRIDVQIIIKSKSLNLGKYLRQLLHLLRNL